VRVRASLFLLCCTFFCAACTSKKTGESADAPAQLAKFGVTLKIPRGFEPLPQEQMRNIEALKATIIQTEPFTVIPRYAYADSSGKGMLVISELAFTEPDKAALYPMENLYRYQKSLETYFGAGEITYEEISGDISVVLLGMEFNEGESAVSLFKGLCFKYPELFFMVDLYLLNKELRVEDAAAYQNMFSSIGIF
jgi:hypothetical protein